MFTAVATGVGAVSSYNTSTQVGADYMKNNVRLCGLPISPHTEVSYKRQNICGSGITVLTKGLYRLSFNRQNV